MKMDGYIQEKMVLLLQKTAWLKRYFLYGETLREDMCKLQYIIF